jgi:hypothetical protein
MVHYITWLSSLHVLSLSLSLPLLDERLHCLILLSVFNMFLQSLTDETLLQILSYLPSHTGVAALSLQCHSWHRLCDMSNRRRYRRVKLREPLDLAVAFRMLRSTLKNPRYGGLCSPHRAEPIPIAKLWLGTVIHTQTAATVPPTKGPGLSDCEYQEGWL